MKLVKAFFRGSWIMIRLIAVISFVSWPFILMAYYMETGNEKGLVVMIILLGVGSLIGIGYTKS